LQEDTSLLQQLEGTRSNLLRLSAELRSVEAQNDQLRVAAAARSLQREEQRELQGKVAELRKALEKATTCRDRLRRQTSELEDQAATQHRLARAYEEGAQELRPGKSIPARRSRRAALPARACGTDLRSGSRCLKATPWMGSGGGVPVPCGSSVRRCLGAWTRPGGSNAPGSLRRFSASGGYRVLQRAMTIGIDLLRKDKGGDPEVVRESERRRFRGQVKQKFQLDEKRKEAEVNKVQSQITEKKKASKGQDKCPAPSCGSATLEVLKGLWYFERFYYLEPHTHPLKPRGEDLLQQKTALEGEAADFEKVVEETQAKRDKLLGAIGNLAATSLLHVSTVTMSRLGELLWACPRRRGKRKQQSPCRAVLPKVHDTVPVSQDEDKDNKVVATWGVPRSFEGKTYQADDGGDIGDAGHPYVEEEGIAANGFRPHFELLEMIGAVEFDAGLEVAGHRGYFLSGPGVLLNQALINYGLAFLSQRGYTPLQPPFFMKKDLMAKTAELAAGLADYDDVLYKVIEDKDHPELDKYLIATSEQPISAFHRGRDIRGIFRVHQFEKIEQFVLTDPEKSWEEHESMIAMAQEFYQSLGIPYRTVAIVSGELNNAAAKKCAAKYDLEGWFPGDNEGKGKCRYRELVSCSNCLDYQARAMQTKFGYRPEDPQFCHMLNSTLCATVTASVLHTSSYNASQERALCSIVENYQEQVPRALVPFLLGQEFFPFVKTVKEERPAAKGKDAGLVVCSFVFAYRPAYISADSLRPSVTKEYKPLPPWVILKG
ncbi:serS, partial [Symbiodinium sp. KB8]